MVEVFSYRMVQDFPHTYPRSFAKKILHPSGHMAILSLPCGYELKDVSGIFQPRFISFGAERKIVWLRMKNRLPEIEESFG
ncbi:MAG: hypothetical protein ACLRPS_08850 [Paraprevotella clara]|uniref:hypothetical protein n=1 Tax=Paraprevotella clara TaxID=454154 RepID=UPI003994E5BE